ncbi:DUF438 domain-containing protein [Caldithrix abyssi]|uniref:Putative PAS/PAC sensor protein n=1 Tax=Caldithrix abyssi DSM 13497 TaxID=880073 RepID=H1XVL5_CALAY|nr:DUF438 domain-containing protein [Caldithrix abyssi]APF18957.1 hypothetical protein Cabys_2208 [Caldithrix abyssi DSM 13497]EHO42915.1 putative PAS/PAC sensor protein [Caldithrix abyssi DSM 13497]
MSELINNRQERIEVMKNLIRQLHEGRDEEKVRRQLESVLQEADYSDVFLMEIQLMEEGISRESITKLCDVHTKVLKKHLDLTETPDAVPGHPLHTFLQENQALLQRTAHIRKKIAELEKVSEEESADVLMKIRFLLNELMDVDKHYRRKENLLFPFFEKNNLHGPSTVMWTKHDETRSYLKSVIQALNEAENISQKEMIAFARLAIEPAIESVEEMIYKEEKILFPTAMDLLTEQDWYDIYLQSPEIGFCLYYPEFEWVPEGGLVENVEKIKASDDKIHLPTGSFTLEQLINIFKTLPVDLTFVDAEDTVRYFSPGKDRIFDRSRTILGRKVQYCHPPKSVNIVNQIIKDFKEGKQDVARFWINFGGRFIYISYYAIRNDQGTYLGTLEVTQDLTDLRALEGERRLLQYDEE